MRTACQQANIGPTPTVNCTSQDWSWRRMTGICSTHVRRRHLLRRSGGRGFGSLTLCLVDLVGGTGIEPVTSSVSGKIGRIAPRRLTWPNMAFTCDFICWTAPGVAHILALLALNLALG